MTLQYQIEIVQLLKEIKQLLSSSKTTPQLSVEQRCLLLLGSFGNSISTDLIEAIADEACWDYEDVFDLISEAQTAVRTGEKSSD